MLNFLNVPSYARDFDASIFTRDGQDLWFYGSYSLSDANEVALEMKYQGIDASVYRKEEIFKEEKEYETEELQRATKEDWKRFTRWIDLNKESKLLYKASIERELIEYEKRFLEVMSL